MAALSPGQAAVGALATSSWASAGAGGPVIDQELSAGRHLAQRTLLRAAGILSAQVRDEFLPLGE